jgi:predicted HTH domain antitoxin
MKNKIQKALEQYRKNEASISKASEISGLSIRDVTVLLHTQNIDFNYLKK